MSNRRSSQPTIISAEDLSKAVIEFGATRADVRKIINKIATSPCVGVDKGHDDDRGAFLKIRYNFRTTLRQIGNERELFLFKQSCKRINPVTGESTKEEVIQITDSMGKFKHFAKRGQPKRRGGDFLEGDTSSIFGG